MSKMFNKYLKLKSNNNDIVYLFKSGIFFIALQDDANLLSKELTLKITHLNEYVIKCGFPISREDYYFNLLALKNIPFEVITNLQIDALASVNNIQYDKIKHTLKKIAVINFDEITFKQAYEILLDVSIEVKKYINKGGTNGES